MGLLRGILKQKRTRWPSETSKCRARLAPYCAGYGIDAGFGGDPIVDHAIRIDRPRPYTDVGSASVQLGGNATRLEWFRDGTLDFVYSSHLLEDFEDTESVLREWLRVLRPGGRLILFCPDEQEFRIGETHVLHEVPLVDSYSWELVVEKRPR